MSRARSVRKAQRAAPRTAPLMRKLTIASRVLLFTAVNRRSGLPWEEESRPICVGGDTAIPPPGCASFTVKLWGGGGASGADGVYSPNGYGSSRSGGGGTASAGGGAGVGVTNGLAGASVVGGRGGGGGYYGGGGGAFDIVGGSGGGGSSYVGGGGGLTLSGASTAGGSGANPGNGADIDRGSAGTGGATCGLGNCAGSAGENGIVVINYP